MRWSVLAIVLAVVSLLLTALTLGSAFLAVLPARGGEDLLRFAGESLIGAMVTALAATALSVLAWRRRLSSGRNVVAIIGLVTGLLAMLASGTVVGLWGLLTEKGKQDEAKIAEAKTRHELPLSTAELARAHPMSADALAKEWMADHDACDAKHRDEIVELTWSVAGNEWVDGTTCPFLLDHGDVVCCLAAGKPAPASGVVTFVARYAGTDRRYSPPGRDQGKLVFDGCGVK